MKKFITLAILSLSLVASTASFAQTSKWKPKTEFIGKDNRVWFSDGTQMLQHPSYQLDSVTTTNATVTAVDTVYIGNNEAGVLKVTVVGYKDTDGSAVTGIKLVRYNKVNGTLTVGTATSALAVEADTNISTATFGVSSTSNKIIVTVTGVAATTIRWTSTVEKIAKFHS